MGHLVASPCCQPARDLPEALANFAALGFGKFEWFSHWVSSAFDIDADAINSPSPESRP